MQSPATLRSAARHPAQRAVAASADAVPPAAGCLRGQVRAATQVYAARAVPQPARPVVKKHPVWEPVPDPHCILDLVTPVVSERQRTRVRCLDRLPRPPRPADRPGFPLSGGRAALRPTKPAPPPPARPQATPAGPAPTRTPRSRCVVRDSDSGHQLLLPPTNGVPCLRSGPRRTPSIPTTAGRPGWTSRCLAERRSTAFP